MQQKSNQFESLTKPREYKQEQGALKSKQASKFLMNGKYYLEGNENDPYRIGSFLVNGFPIHIRKRKTPTEKLPLLFIDTTKPKYTYISSLYQQDEQNYSGDFKGQKFSLYLDLDGHSVKISLKGDDK